jgi:hypothetical protein
LVVLFDLMLEELATALVVSRSLEAASPGIAEPSPAPAAPSPHLPVQELLQLTPPRAGQLNVEDNDTTPTPCEAARCLARFTEEVLIRRVSPLIASPPRQMVATRRNPLPKRSRGIAAQPLTHIPTSKRGKMLLMQRMSFAPPAAPVSSASKRAYDDLFAVNLTSSEVEALDALFPATNAMTSRRLFLDDEAGSRGEKRSRPAP